MTTRREFVVRLAGGSAALVAGAKVLSAQKSDSMPMMMHDSSMRDTQNLFVMDQGAARSVVLPAKPGAKPVLDVDARNELEHQIHCQCGCTLNVYTCRTTDFSCQVSPAMHRNIMALVEQGHSAQEIIDGFVATYGERALMAPRKTGFNLVAWVTPGAAVVVAATALVMVLRGWSARRPAPGATTARPADATSDELARLEAAVRSEDDA